ncbi:peptide transporter family 1-like [Chironomus tepperi]|uniref:peptide transporter family 1-like n=1 Tax=Chironomus tepperi TaxID=113505 RepID=UPI00391F4018
MDQNKARDMPKPVPFIIFYALCERYSSMGVAAILAIFLNTKLDLSEHASTAIYHYFYFASYFFGIIGAIIADNWLGRFKTLFFGMSILGGLGNLLLAVGTIAYLSYLINSFTTVALLLISFGIGCLEPNLPAYSGDQYRLPLEERGFALCIGLLFIMQNAARVIAMIVGPLLRSRTKCFGADDCYPLIFGIFVAAKFFAIMLLTFGRKYAVVVTPSGNMFTKVIGCVWYGLKGKFGSSDRRRYNHWLDRSEKVYGKRIVADTKRVLHVLALLPPLVITASLYFQQASRWVFQSRQMDGQIGNFNIKPDQVPLVNALSVVIFVPLCEYVFNPLLSKIGIKTNLHRVILGGFLSATAFVIAALVQFQVDQKQLHMVWQVPQHMVLALGEVLVYVQILQFAYTQAPKEMKSVLQAFFSMIIGGGNLIVALIASTRLFESMAYEYLMFAGIVYLAMIIFAFLAARYEYVDVEELEKLDKMTEYDGFEAIDESSALNNQQKGKKVDNVMKSYELKAIN